jgi:hypothetical protein
MPRSESRHALRGPDRETGEILCEPRNLTGKSGALTHHSTYPNRRDLGEIMIGFELLGKLGLELDSSFEKIKHGVISYFGSFS